jgi:hypothetical protein
MIPKQLFFIWFGDTQPNYVNFSINAFKEVNPDFKINFLRYTINDLNNKNIVSEFDNTVYDCINYIYNLNDKYIDTIKRYKSYNRKFIIILADIVRLELLYRYGGIYLDCDTFPRKPFDDKILNCESFYSYTYTSYDSENRHPDGHFIGCLKGCDVSDFYKYKCEVNTQKYHYFNDEEWIVNRKLFYNCILDYRLYNDEYYIDHFIDRTWLNNKIENCKYDR